jgi:hypothetical protein
MKKFFAIAGLSLFLLPFSGCAHHHPPPYYAPPPPDAVARQGFDNGVAAARRDISLGKRPDVNRHRPFRNPPVPPGQPAQIYRDNFHRGYTDTYRGGR